MIVLFGGRLRISVFALMLFLVISFSCDAAFLYIALLCAAFHETGHIAAMKLCGAEIVCMTIYPFGAEIRADTSELSYRDETVSALAGPFVSALLTAAFFLLWRMYGNIYLLSAFLSNFLFFAVNIFPVRGLDGGRALFAFLMMKLDVSRAYTVFSYVSAVFFGVLCACALFLLAASGYNLSLIFICVYLFLAEYIKCRGEL